jgi:hypothetical protein
MSSDSHFRSRQGANWSPIGGAKEEKLYRWEQNT